MESNTRYPSEEMLKELKLSKQKSGDDVHSRKTNKDKEGGSSSNEGKEKIDDKEALNLKVSHGFHLVKGKMYHGMEDYIVAENKEINGHDLGLYAIFDGHSGREVAEYLQHHLFDNILSEADFWTSPKIAFRRAYRITDEEILERVVGSRGGSTAVTAMLIDQNKLIIANVGDSQAVICSGDKAKQISIDHEPTKEKELVESRGGFVTKMPGNVPRVDGRLAMTRAFGDAQLKEHITSEPDVKVVTVDKNTEFLILASDGLWKVMSNEEAFNCVKDLVDNAQEAAEELVREALSRNSNDDISCVVVIFS